MINDMINDMKTIMLSRPYRMLSFVVISAVFLTAATNGRIPYIGSLILMGLAVILYNILRATPPNQPSVMKRPMPAPPPPPPPPKKRRPAPTHYADLDAGDVQAIHISLQELAKAFQDGYDRT